MHYLAMAINLSVPDMGGKGGLDVPTTSCSPGAGKAEGGESASNIPSFLIVRRERRLGL